MRNIAIAGLQIEVKHADNTETICNEILAVKRVYPFVDMMVVPELSWFGLDPNKAVELPGPAEDAMRRVAKEAGIWLVGGSIFERSGGKIYNTCPVINPNGEVVLRYRKMYPFLPYEKGVTAGDRCMVFEVPSIGTFGISICYDMWFPETIRQMTWMGAEVIIHPSMTNTIDRDAETAICRANAAMHQSYFVDVNASGIGAGMSCVHGPGGELIHQAATGREIVIVEIDLDLVRHVREHGWHGLGQPVKSYRDANIAYPVYAEGANASPAFRDLGPMHFHKPRKLV